MSSQNPRPPRRRIAGERRPSRPDAGRPEPQDEPVSLEKQRPDDRGDAAPPPPPASPAPAAPAEAAGAAGAGGAGGRPAPSWLVVAALGVVALLLVVTAGVLGLFTWSWSDVRTQDAVDEASRTAPAAAERASVAILSYGYSSLDADEKAAERYMTPGYRKKYADTFNRLVKPNATKLKAKVEAEVKASGVAHADADRVNVLLYVNQTTRSTANGGEPQVALNRVQLSMVKRGGTWLVNDITSY
jgi:Mce-associated membrane protein